MPTLTVAATLMEECIDLGVRYRGARMLVAFAGLDVDAAMDLEGEVARAAQQHVESYLEHMRRMAFNIACNNELTQQPADRLVFMTDEELSAGTLVERVQKEELERMQAFSDLLREKYDNVVKAQSSESLLRCRNCGGSDITWNQKQTRSADESSTIFCCCLNPKCKKRWRLS